MLPMNKMLLFSACAVMTSVAAAAVPSTKRMEYTMAVGEQKEILLHSNASTGFVWEVISYDAVSNGTPVLEADSPVQVELEILPPSRGNGPMLCGAPGKTRVTLKAVKAPGTLKVTLGYLRPWEKGTAPMLRCEINVVVK